MIEAAVAENHLEDDVVLSGSFCTGKCNRIGVTVSVNDEIYTGITKENFRDFFEERIKKPRWRKEVPDGKISDPEKIQLQKLL